MTNKKIEHVSVPGINVELNKKLGYYIFDNNIYYHKLQALLESSKMLKSSTPSNKYIRWVFNDDVFIKYPWHIEPEESLQELYRRRAQQLRDTYDYIRLEASGGSDSTTVAYSFLLNGIHLDEIVFRYPKKGDKNVAGNAGDTRCENTLSEWNFAAKPLLDWVATNYPKTKITVHDYTDEIIEKNQFKDESWIFKTRHYLQPAHAHKHTNTGYLDHRRTADKDLKIAVVYGIDKPKICIKDGKFFLYFSDQLANHNNPDMGDYTNITNEFFYWTPDMPELIAKQAHITKDWFSMKEHHQFQNTLHWPNFNFAARNLYENIVKRIVYPDYDFNTFQVMKPTNNIYNEMDTWFHVNFKNSQYYQGWEAGINYLLTNLDDRYMLQLDGQIKNITDFMSIFYYLGDSNIPEIGAMKTKDMLYAERRKVDTAPYIHCINNKLSIY